MIVTPYRQRFPAFDSTKKTRAIFVLSLKDSVYSIENIT